MPVLQAIVAVTSGLIILWLLLSAIQLVQVLSLMKKGKISLATFTPHKFREMAQGSLLSRFLIILHPMAPCFFITDLSNIILIVHLIILEVLNGNMTNGI